VLGKWAIKEQRYGTGFNAVMFRRTTVSSEDAIERSKQIYRPLGGKFNESKLTWRMPNGGRVAFAYLDSVDDANEYLGRNVTDAWVEEAGQYEDPAPIDRLYGFLRSASGVPIQLIITANPGGAGQHWLRNRYRLEPFPKSPITLTRVLPTRHYHYIAVIPSRITDNKVLLEADPGYIDRLHMVGSEQLVRAWLDGDWSAVEGAFFDCFDIKRHVLEPFDVPRDWLRFRSADWGSASPFSIGWWAVVQDDYWLRRQAGDPPDVPGRYLPKGALLRYREWYGASAPGKGLKLTAEQVAHGIILREKDVDPKLVDAVIDPSVFKEDGGPSIGERINFTLAKGGLLGFRPGDNTRVTSQGNRDRRGPMNGWDAMRQRMVGTEEAPMIFWFDTCTDSIRTIRVLQHDSHRAEDLDTMSEDHAADDTRYACSSRPWLKPVEPLEAPVDGYRGPDDDLMDGQGASFMTL